MEMQPPNIQKYIICHLKLNNMYIIWFYTATSRNGKEREEIDMQINGLPETITGGMCSRRAKRAITFTCCCADPLLRAGSRYFEIFSST